MPPGIAVFLCSLLAKSDKNVTFTPHKNDKNVTLL